MSWGMIAAVSAGGLAAFAILRPWRFFLARNRCPQCRQLLARWNFWGWKDDWSCPRCGCQVRR